MTCAVDHIPSELKRCPQWVVWQVEPRNGKPTKVPYYPYGGMPPIRARSDDPKMWRGFEEAQQALKANRYDGLGFMFSKRDSFCGIDLDDVIDPETGEVDEEAVDVVRLLDSYKVSDGKLFSGSGGADRQSPSRGRAAQKRGSATLWGKLVEC